MEPPTLYNIDLEIDQSLDNLLHPSDATAELLPTNSLDSIVKSVVNKFIERANTGKKKYGKDLDRSDLTIYEWIQHAQEEHMDAILYLEKLKKECFVSSSTFPKYLKDEPKSFRCTIL